MVFISVRFFIAAPVFHASKGASSKGFAGAAMAAAAACLLPRLLETLVFTAGRAACPGRTKKPCHSVGGAEHLQGACVPRACIVAFLGARLSELPLGLKTHVVLD